MHLHGLSDVLVKRRSIGAAVSCYLRLNAFASLGSCHACYHPCYTSRLFALFLSLCLSVYLSLSLSLYLLRIVHTSTKHVIGNGLVALAWNMSHPVTGPYGWRYFGDVIQKDRISAKFRPCQWIGASAHLTKRIWLWTSTWTHRRQALGVRSGLTRESMPTCVELQTAELSFRCSTHTHRKNAIDLSHRPINIAWPSKPCPRRLWTSNHRCKVSCDHSDFRNRHQKMQHLSSKSTSRSFFLKKRSLSILSHQRNSWRNCPSIHRALSLSHMR